MKKPMVLSLCDRTGIMVQPWLDAGFPCTIVDLQHKPGTHKDEDQPLLTRVGIDILKYLPPLQEYRIVFAFPPCTHLAVSGARWWKQKGLGALIEGLTLVERTRELCEWPGAPYMIENPVGSISSYWRKPDYTFDPCDFGDPYTKKTHLWTGNNFIFPQTKRIHPYEGSKMHLMWGSKSGNERSVTPKGFANAVFAANEPDLHFLSTLDRYNSR